MNGETELLQVLTGLCLGVGLSAACGFRIFVPMLFLSIAGRLGAEQGGIDLSPGFEWITSVPAVVGFGAATALEIGAYYVPWLDNALDSLATPAAIVAGTVATASVVGDVNPLLRWSLALVAGGGTAAVVQGGTVVMRTLSAATTGGLGNPVVSTGEAGASFALSLLALLVPVLAGAVVVLLVAWAVRSIYRWYLRRREQTVEPLAA